MQPFLCTLGRFRPARKSRQAGCEAVCKAPLQSLALTMEDMGLMVKGFLEVG